MDFRSRYRRECLLSGTSPLHAVESQLQQLVLDFKFFRIPITEWTPLLVALAADTSLKQISIKIDFGDYTVSNPTHQQKLKHLGSLCESLSLHLSRNTKLNSLKLLALPLAKKDINILSEGIKSSTSLEHLSLARCMVGDDGTRLVCEAVQGKPSIVWLDLSSCKLTAKCGEALHQLVSSQTAARENALWKAQLREERPNSDLMGGLRRLTLNDNDLGDAVTRLVAALCEDKWIKVVDLQFCHLTDYHANGLLQAAGRNQSLALIDVRHNANLSTLLVEKLNETVKINALATNGDSAYRFKPIDVDTAPTTTPAGGRTKTTFGVKRLKSDKKAVSAANVSWRIAARHAAHAGTERRSAPEAPASPKRTVPETPTPSPAANVVDSARSVRRPSPRKKIASRDNSHVDVDKTDLDRERQLRLDAERQVIRIYAELEAAWSRTTKLERKLRHIKRHSNSHVVPTTVLPTTVLSNNDPQMGIWVDPSTLTAFQTCLFQLRGILRELKTSTSISAATTAAPPPPAGPSGGEAEAIMETLQTAIRELAARMPPPRRVEVDGRQNSQDALFSQQLAVEDPRPLPPWVDSVRSVLRTDPGCRTPPAALAPTGPSSATFKRSTPAAPSSGAIEAAAMDRQRNHLTSTPLSDAAMAKSNVQQQLQKSKSTSSSSVASGKENRAASTSYPPAPESARNSRSESRRSKEPSSTASDRPSSARSTGEARLTSLKNLKGDLENLLSQFRPRDEVSSLNATQMQATLVSLDTSVKPPETTASGAPASHCSGLVEAAEDQYSMNFDDSTATSIRSLGLKSKLSQVALSAAAAVPATGASGRRSAGHSKSSSTLNMSSIVDLLGDFSLADIGSSTLTPP